MREISPARPEFHARFSTESKNYHYKIYNAPIMDPFLCRYAYHSTYNLNSAAMREAAKHFIGKHDFSAFANATTDDKLRDPIKNIYRFDVVEMVFIEPQSTICSLFSHVHFGWLYCFMESFFFQKEFDCIQASCKIQQIILD